jgi:adenylate cyclase
MDPTGSGRGAGPGVAMAALALAGLLFSWTPASERIDGAVLDLMWKALRRVEVRPAPDEIVIVGIDEESMRAIPQPPGLWHEPLGLALVRIASAKPRAIGLDVALPERSFDSIRSGMDRALMTGLATARHVSPVVAPLVIDPETRSARTIHPPFLAALGSEGLGIEMLPREADGVTRRFSLLVPTEDGAFPSLEGRLCRALARQCGDGYINFALGKPFTYVSFRKLLETRDLAWLEARFRDRIVLIGEAQRVRDRIEVPVNPAGWEGGGHDAPGIAVHAQSLRTALLDAAPQPTSRPFGVVLVTLCALVVLPRGRRLAAGFAAGGAILLVALSLVVLRGGWVMPISGGLFTLALAALSRTAWSWRTRGTGAGT